jgi:hypothetical protein
MQIVIPVYQEVLKGFELFHIPAQCSSMPPQLGMGVEGSKISKQELRGITSGTSLQMASTNTKEVSRKPKLLKELTMMNRQSCLSKILCGVEVAKKPSSSTSTINDYAYLVKNFFDRFS